MSRVILASIAVLAIAVWGCVGPSTLLRTNLLESEPRSRRPEPVEWVGPSARLAVSQDPALDQEEQILFEEINSYRTSQDLVPLSTDPTLFEVADWMANDMASKNYWPDEQYCAQFGLGAHCDSLGRDTFQRMAAFGFTANTLKGENLGAGVDTGEAIFAPFKNSPGHNALLLEPEFRIVGIARAYGEGTTFGWYWAVEFAGPIPEPPPLTPPSPPLPPPSPPTPPPVPPPPPSENPGPEPPPPPSSQPPPETQQYVVVSGDTLSAIAERFGMSIQELTALNPQIKNPDLIFPGQVIFVKKRLLEPVAPSQNENRTETPPQDTVPVPDQQKPPEDAPVPSPRSSPPTPDPEPQETPSQKTPSPLDENGGTKEAERPARIVIVPASDETWPVWPLLAVLGWMGFSALGATVLVLFAGKISKK